MHVCCICDHKLETGMLFCDHSTTIEAISVVKPNKNNNLYSKWPVRNTVNIYS